MNIDFDSQHLATVIHGQMEGRKPIYPGIETISLEKRVENALGYYNDQIYCHGNNAIRFESIPRWLREAARIRSALIAIKSFVIAPGRDILR